MNVNETDFATLYAQKVVSGEILASKKNIQTCQRHLDNIANGVNGYEWRPDLARKVAKFISLLPDTKTGKPMPLLLFQHFIVGSLYGWVQEGTELRRFNKAYISTSRKQGKSIINAGIAQYELMFGNSPERQREIYIASNAYKQAQIIFGMATSQFNMMKKNSKYLNDNIKTINTEIKYLKDESIIKALSNNPDSADGTNPSCIILDEYGEMKDTLMYGRLKTGMGQQENPLTVICSTAGSNLNNPMYAEEYQYITKLLNNEILDENYFVYCAELDDEAEYEDESNWIKAMPLLEHETKRQVILKNIKADINEQLTKGNMKDVMIKNFNMWQNNMKDNEVFLKQEHWQRNYIEQPNINGTDVYIGVDLSRRDDLSAIGMIHTFDNYIWINSHSFVPFETNIDDKIRKDKINYIKHEQLGECSITNDSNGIINYKQIVDYIKKYVTDNKLNLKGIYFDRAYGETFIEIMSNLYPEAKLIEVQQNMVALSPTIKSFRYDVQQNKIKHSNNQLLNIAVNNARLKFVNDNVMIKKDTNRNKIDPVMSIIDAYTDVQYYEYAKPSLEERLMKGEFTF